MLSNPLPSPLLFLYRDLDIFWSLIERPNFPPPLFFFVIRAPIHRGCLVVSRASLVKNDPLSLGEAGPRTEDKSNPTLREKIWSKSQHRWQISVSIGYLLGLLRLIDPSVFFHARLKFRPSFSIYIHRWLKFTPLKRIIYFPDRFDLFDRSLKEQGEKDRWGVIGSNLELNIRRELQKRNRVDRASLPISIARKHGNVCAYFRVAIPLVWRGHDLKERPDNGLIRLNYGTVWFLGSTPSLSSPNRAK